MTSVVVIVLDDARFDMVTTCMPSVQDLVLAGTSFTNARANCGACQPARVSLLTGQWSKSHGVLDNSAAAVTSFPHDNTLGKWVRDAGHRTGLIGKYINGAGTRQPKPAGWDTWRQLVPGTGNADQNAYGWQVTDGTSTTTPGGHQLDYLLAQALTFLGGATPFFLLFPTTLPHWPHNPLPAQLHDWSRTFWPVDGEPDVSDKPSWIRAMPPLTSDERNVTQALARGFLRELSSLDVAVADLVAALPSDTTVILTSDNGHHLGEHRIIGRGAKPVEKRTLYDPAIHLPLVVVGDGFPAGTTVTAPVCLEDVTATVVAIAGATAGLPGDGVDLRAIAADPGAYATRVLLHEKGDSTAVNGIPAAHGVTSSTRKLVRYSGATGADAYEMYDLDSDPDELVNVAYVPARLAERDALEAELDGLLA